MAELSRVVLANCKAKHNVEANAVKHLNPGLSDLIEKTKNAVREAENSVFNDVDDEGTDSELANKIETCFEKVVSYSVVMKSFDDYDETCEAMQHEQSTQIQHMYADLSKVFEYKADLAAIMDSMKYLTIPVRDFETIRNYNGKGSRSLQARLTKLDCHAVLKQCKDSLNLKADLEAKAKLILEERAAVEAQEAECVKLGEKIASLKANLSSLENDYLSLQKDLDKGMVSQQENLFRLDTIAKDQVKIRETVQKLQESKLSRSELKNKLISWLDREGRHLSDLKVILEAERLKREEAERLKREEAERLKREEAERLKREETERLKREEAERLKREEAERLKREEEERLKREEAERLKREEEERLKREEEERLKREEEERLKREEEERLKREEEERLKREEEERLKREEEERLKRKEEERLKREEAERLKREEEERLKREEAERLKREEEERLKREEEERLKRAEEERLKREEEERLKREEWERLKREEEERLKREEEERLKREEEERLKREEEERLAKKALRDKERERHLEQERNALYEKLFGPKTEKPKKVEKVKGKPKPPPATKVAETLYFEESSDGESEEEYVPAPSKKKRRL
ncbi:hypothetical protein QR680_008673 [Steinernema hermaphroditum]|uniref:Uncharacterized protein n=1 Tax=Steinernema hermaphroditum TaxID=289476 RepID=A0AA39M7F9_9BILA|nr:hypothetical protein QR680_008673 [Steinernema hermaphroditum]